MGVNNTETSHCRPWTLVSRCDREMDTTDTCKETQTGARCQARSVLEHNTHSTGCPYTLLLHGHPFAHQSQHHTTSTTPTPARVVASCEEVSSSCGSCGEVVWSAVIASHRLPPSRRRSIRLPGLPCSLVERSVKKSAHSSSMNIGCTDRSSRRVIPGVMKATD